MTELPRFRTVLRGFDPDQVTATVTELTTSLAIARRTAAQRTMDLAAVQEREAALKAELDEALSRLAAVGSGDTGRSHAFEDVGDRVNTILGLAQKEAAQVRAECERYADEVRRAAETDAARIRAEAAQAAQAAQAAEALRQNAAPAGPTSSEAAQEAIAEAKKTAAQIVEAARRDASATVEQARHELDAAERVRDEVQARLDQLVELLVVEEEALSAEPARERQR